jgi:hypothetical protein
LCDTKNSEKGFFAFEGKKERTKGTGWTERVVWEIQTMAEIVIEDTNDGEKQKQQNLIHH